MHPIYWICADELAVNDVVGARRGSHQGICKNGCIFAGWDQVGSDPLAKAQVKQPREIWGYVRCCEAIQFNDEPIAIVQRQRIA